ncbi:oxidoreductase family protein [Colletotrichum tofieldiae]|nr:Oxidoreductase family protein [Colletotrichum tofieldiae]GKT72738.1 oxidoreductase family protein [Colletotrichum tofieldiae]GKT89421.1 oxidoreductase family protein [Colletotrichum tofieldiae]
MSGQLCVDNVIPANLPLAENISSAAIPGRIISEPMVACCSPNPVQLVEKCHEWCELPET